MCTLDRKKIIENGWKQGACLYVRELPPEPRDQLREKGVLWEDDDLLIVASQSCDVVTEKLKVEPYVELIKSTPYSDTNSHLHDNNFTNAKNSRNLQLTAPEFASKKFLHLFIHDRVLLDRNFIETHAIDSSHCLDAVQLQILKTWLGARYNRASFPDKFLEWAKSGIGRMRERLDKQAGGEHVCKYVEGIYMRVEPDKEVADDESYDLYCFALISPNTPSEATGKITRAMQDLVSRMNSKQVCVQTEDSLVMQTTEITIADLMGYKKYYFDDLSLKRGETL